MQRIELSGKMIKVHNPRVYENEEGGEMYRGMGERGTSRPCSTASHMLEKNTARRLYPSTNTFLFLAQEAVHFFTLKFYAYQRDAQ